MPSVIIITKFGEVKQKNTKYCDESDFYRLCNYKNTNDFKQLHVYKTNTGNYEIFGKDKGRANSENKYEFPPPIDNTLYFGNLCIFKSIGEEYVDLTKEDWDSTYESLFGGFEDICNEDETRSLDSEVYSDEEYTTEGYLKDDFIVDDDELVEEEYLSE